MPQSDIWATIIMYIAGAIGIGILTFIFFSAWAKNKKAKNADVHTTTKDDSTH